MKADRAANMLPAVDRRKVFFGLPMLAAGIASARGALAANSS